MPSQSVSDSATTIQTQSSTPIQPFHDVLAELSAGIVILGDDQRQQKLPSGTIDGSIIKQFGHPGVKEIGIPLPEVLWAFALIFSPCRKGKFVVASVLGEESQKQDPEKSLFTLYLTANDSECWKTCDKAYIMKWQDAVNYPTKTKLDFSSDLWRELTRICATRIKGYAEGAQRNMRVHSEDFEKQTDTPEIKCEARTEHLDALVPPKDSVAYSAIENLIKEIQQSLETDLSDATALVLLTEKCWKLMKENGDTFKELYNGSLRKSDIFTNTGRTLKLKRVRLILKSIDNLAKVPRAFFIFSKFWSIMVTQKARFQITPLPGPDGKSCSPKNYSELVLKSIRRLGELSVERENQLIKCWENSALHCEIQMLEYFDKHILEKTGVWNVIGCSKNPCFACAQLLRASDFLFKESNGKAYSQNLLCAEEWLNSNTEMRSAIVRLNEEVLTSIRENKSRKHSRNIMPDSPILILQDWNPSVVRTPDPETQAEPPPTSSPQPLVWLDALLYPSQWDVHDRVRRLIESLRFTHEGI